MKHLNKFNESTWWYASSRNDDISHEYIRDVNNEPFSKYEVSKIEEWFHNDTIHWTEPYEVNIIKSDVFKDVPESELLVTKGLNKLKVNIEIHKKEDGWFYVIDVTRGSRSVYKCDQWNGLMDFLTHRKYIS
jgi:hypothetical protein